MICPPVCHERPSYCLLVHILFLALSDHVARHNSSQFSSKTSQRDLKIEVTTLKKNGPPCVSAERQEAWLGILCKTGKASASPDFRSSQHGKVLIVCTGPGT